MRFEESFSLIGEILKVRMPAVLADIAARKVASAFEFQLLESRLNEISNTHLQNHMYSLDIETRKFQISTKFKLKLYGRLAACTFQVVALFVRRPPQLKHAIANVLYGLESAKYKGLTKRRGLSQYLSNLSSLLNVNEIWFLDNPSSLVGRRISQNIYISPCPVLLARLTKLGYRKRFNLFLIWVWKLLGFLIKILHTPELLLVSREFLTEQIFLDRSGTSGDIANLFCTNSRIFVQPPSFYQSKSLRPPTFMIWYSSSAHDSHVDYGPHFDSTIFSAAICDTHLVWNKTHKSFLETVCQAEVLVVGPQLFYVPTLVRVDKLPIIGVFDITPTAFQILKGTPFSEERAIDFIRVVSDSIRVINEEESNSFSMQIKTKRGFAPIHSSKYVKTIQKLNSQGVEVIDSEINLFDYLNSVTLVVTNSLTSIGDLANFLGVNVLYYDDEKYYRTKRRGCDFAINQEDLLVKLRAKLINQ